MEERHQVFELQWQALKPALMPTIRKAKRMISFSAIADEGDLESLAMLALWEAIQNAPVLERELLIRFTHRRFIQLVWRMAFDISALHYPKRGQFFKAAVRETPESLEALMEKQGDFLMSPDSDLQNVELATYLRDMSTSPLQEQVAHLFIIEGRGFPEIAQFCGLSLHEVRRAWQQLVRRMRRGEKW